MHNWITAVTDELSLQGVEVTDGLMKEILAVARDAAHNVERPAAPLTTYLMGIAVAQGADPADVARRVGQLAENWSAEQTD
jgi:Domain of unknown function (DUF6457)